MEQQDGLSEKSLVAVLYRIFISNMTRCWMVYRDKWLDMAESCLCFLRSTYPVLVGGHAGLAMGDFKSLLKVSTLFI